MKLRALALLCASASCLRAQSPPEALPQLTPQAAFDQAVRPVEIVHRSVANWSDVEQASFAVAVKSATSACASRKPADYTGDQLIAMARLCALGLNFPAVLDATTRYIAAPGPQLSLAYALKIEAALQLHDRALIIATARAMLAAVPYDSTADGAMNEALAYISLVLPGDALVLYGLREPILLKQLASPKPLLPVALLYADGTAFATQMQFGQVPAAPAQEVALLDAALPDPLAPDDAVLIAETRRLYALLGRPLPPIFPTLSLYDPRETPHLASAGKSTVILLFPDWCAQCVRLAPELLPAMNTLGRDGIHLDVLLAAVPPDKASMVALAAQRKPTPAHAAKSPAELLLHTPTLVVPPSTLHDFAASDFPFLIVTDHAGIVRYAAPASESLLGAGDTVERITTRVAREWPAAPGTPD